MVSYSGARALIIENVEHPIHILGVQAQAIVGCFWGFIAIMAINPLFAPMGALTFAVLSRLLFIKEQAGFPLKYERKLTLFFSKRPFSLITLLTPTELRVSKVHYYGF
jgi:hypothetical protein